MARARVNKDGDKVILKLSFREAAALRALLARVGPETDPDINEVTYDTFLVLDNLMEEVHAEDTRLWPVDYENFANREGSLIDPGEPYQLELPLEE